MASGGIDFAGNGSDDLSSAPMTTGQPESASRGAQGPILMAGSGSEDVGGTIGDTSIKGGEMPPKGGGVEFAGEVGHD